MRIGDIEILPVLDGTGQEAAAEVLTRPGVDDPWSCHPVGVDASGVDHDGILHLPLGGFLVRTGERVVLVDAGVGTIDNGKYAGGGFLDALRGYGVAPEDVTDVVFTHLHFDHVGWATKKGEVVFGNATYRVHADDWAHFVDSADAEAGAVRKLSPLVPQLETFTSDVTIAPGLDARHTPGHTPGSTVYVVSSGDERALLLGDVVHSVVELAEPDWEAVFDVDPAAARAARNALADEVADTDALVVGAHFPGLRFGRVVTTGGNRAFRAI
ncbi:MBL fold metallo-hydrolase [Pseudonocardia sp. H11422]|uniref:MBL fold metallo-hydrolase n=1 Tax=Pseudonocardia sp. H11422 TaxID=2835866 RepID=UPI001BDBF5B1|nr:MBL fold metallo-hydrolase [Pseudonocardia sp. H11422]